ncbi:MAG TPA: hypothetical protein VFP39_03730 [Gemmatimonadales bacterium]|nr:hypothetical protein [Gemmatimonadales bacterium]
MRTFRFFSAGIAAVALVGAACSESSTGMSADKVAVQAAYEGLTGYTDNDFGDPGVVGTAAASVVGGVQSILDTAIAPRFWGRLRVVPGGPQPIFERDIVVQGDSAWVTRKATFQGVFLVDTSADSTFNPSSKPLDDGVQQRAVFARDRAADHGWRLVSLTLLDWQNTAADRRTVQIQNVAVFVNGAPVLSVSNPDSLLSVDTRVPLFHAGDTVKVTMHVANTTGGNFSPGTFGFLHVRHADPAGIRWRRVKMQDDGNGDFERSWVVRFTGRDRFVVDALDAATLELGSADNYRSNEWGIPFRVE